jgi:hypothetical protein
MEVVNTRAALRLSHGLTFHTPAAAPRARNAVANTVTQIRDHTRARASASSAPAISRGTPAVDKSHRPAITRGLAPRRPARRTGNPASTDRHISTWQEIFANHRASASTWSSQRWGLVRTPPPIGSAGAGKMGAAAACQDDRAPWRQRPRQTESI